MRVTPLPCLLLLITAGCAGGAYPSRESLFGDGGVDDVGADCTQLDGDGGVFCPEAATDPCAALVERACEPSCQQAAGCVAARLTRDYEPATCDDALANQLTFPACAASPCETLVERSCGASEPTAQCADSPGCPPALVLRARATDAAAGSTGIADALAACQQALEDATVFAPCP